MRPSGFVPPLEYEQQYYRRGEVDGLADQQVHSGDHLAHVARAIVQSVQRDARGPLDPQVIEVEQRAEGWLTLSTIDPMTGFASRAQSSCQ